MDELEILNAILAVERPWGKFEQFVLNSACTVKIHTVRKSHCCSLQSHEKRAELFIPLDNGALVQRGAELIKPGVGERIFIKRGEKHRFYARENDVRILEISFGDFDEEDIVRHDDKYGRI
jgi:mannose-1-phosphate guanylyltransferase/mannose-6-phosphate isomerase